MTALTIRAVGAQALLEDGGRRGLAHLGVGRSGAADSASFTLANRLVGNQPDAACVEATLGQLSVTTDETVLVAVTGAPVELSRGGTGCAMNAPFYLRAGETLTMGWPSAGLRTYLAVRGGLRGATVLGSVSWDTMAQLGTPPLSPGDVVEVGDAVAAVPVTDQAPMAPMTNAPIELPLLLGPRDDWFSAEAIAQLSTGTFTVTPDSDRVGARLAGPPLPRTRRGELASEPMLLGALQVPTEGRPTLFLADHPVTGGYPVIGVVPARAVPLAAQARPGQVIRFRPQPASSA